MSGTPAKPNLAKSNEPEALTRGTFEMVLFVLACLTVAAVALTFSFQVNRVFDVPKALALKVGGGLLLIGFLVRATVGKGIAFSSVRLFAAPVAALTAAVAASTLFSIDVPMSLRGVYERQFGLQGFLGCVGIFLGTAVALRSRRGAVVGLSALGWLGAAIGTYALLQNLGADPYPFFRGKPHDKVYSFLGNATFAGNALALIFPMSVLLTLTQAADLFAQRETRNRNIGLWTVGLLVELFLLVVPGLWVGSWENLADPDANARREDRRETVYLLSLSLAAAFPLWCAASGLNGLSWMRSEAESSQKSYSALAKGAVAAMVPGIVMGLLFTRTRGAWVGSLVAVAGGLVLLPFLFRDQKALFKKVMTACWSGLAVAGLAFIVYVNYAESFCSDPKGKCLVWARTFRSIPAAFDPARTEYGKGQGTRRYLWGESPRVLLNHAQTLDRQFQDQADYAQNLPAGAIEGLNLPVKTAPTAEDISSELAWRTKLVWLFGIGIETYRYAFMSHKSKLLEALDPMTNHDNPHNNYLYVLASFGILGFLAYLWLLWRLLSVAFRRFLDHESVGWRRTDRAVAFGVVTSFFSYAVYSIAGFDSVACSVFLYFLLGCAAAYFSPSGAEPDQKLPWPQPARWALLLVGGGLALNTIMGGITALRAERAFVGAGEEPPKTRQEYYTRKVDQAKKAIQIQPYESYYKQSLGNAYSDIGRMYRNEARRLEQSGQVGPAENFASRAAQQDMLAAKALYAALDHAWAPENIYISLFQVHYGVGQKAQAERALERGLVHSPHLGAVRANLAILKLERGAFAEALADCKWVLEVDKKSAIAARTCGKASLELGDLAAAERYLTRAKKLDGKDPTTRTYWAQLLAKQTSTTP